MRKCGRVRWGILGYATIARRAVIPAILESEQTELVAVASLRPEPLPGQADWPAGVRLYGDYAALLADPEVEAVYIPLPNHLHCEWTVRAAAAGKHVLCEKPLAVTVPEAERMIEACRRSGVLLMEAFMYRFNPQHASLLGRIAGGDLGELRLVRSSFTVQLDDPAGNVRFGPYSGAGALYDVGIYCINAARLLFGAEPERVWATKVLLPGTTSDAYGSAILAFPQERLAVIDYGLTLPYRNLYEVVGTRGTALVQRPFASPPFQPRRAALDTVLTGVDGPGTERFDDVSQYVLEVDTFARAVRGEPGRLYPPEDSVLTLRVIEACGRAAATGAAVSLP